MQVNTIFSALAGAERVFEVLDEEPEQETSDNTVSLQPLKGQVELRKVSFGYEPEKTILKQINVTAKPGQKIAFVGSTGAGKTTITNLINRFYDIDDGQLLIDGIDIKNMSKDLYRFVL